MKAQKLYNRSVVMVSKLLIFVIATCSIIFLSGCGKESPPAAPLKAGFRPSAVSGLVLQVQNTGDKFLSCKMAAVNMTQKQNAVYSFSLDPYKMQEIGIMECGWMFQHGEKVLIRTEGYEELYFTVP